MPAIDFKTFDTLLRIAALIPKLNKHPNTLQVGKVT